MQFLSRREAKKKAMDPKNPWVWGAFWLILVAAFIRIVIEVINALFNLDILK